MPTRFDIWKCAAGLVLILATPALAEDVSLLLRFGFGDSESSTWLGKIEVSPGRLGPMHGWSFRNDDRIMSEGGFEFKVRAPASKNKKGGVQINGFGVTLRDVEADSLLRVQTATSTVEVPVASIGSDKPVVALDGRLRIQRTGGPRRIAGSEADEGFVTLAPSPDGSIWLGWIAYQRNESRDERVLQFRRPPDDFSKFSVKSSGDIIRVRRLSPEGTWEGPQDLAPSARAISGLALAVTGDGTPWAFWSERRGEVIDLFGQPFANTIGSLPILLGSSEGNDLAPVATTDAAGHIWVAWQGVRDGRLSILVRRQGADGSFHPEQIVDAGDRSSWAPAIAASRRGVEKPRVAVAWDSYEQGDYDIRLRTFDLDGAPEETLTVANEDTFDVRPQLAFDSQDRIWIGWQRSRTRWGKENATSSRRRADGLLTSRDIEVRVLDPKQGWLTPQTQPLSALRVINPLSRRGDAPHPGALPQHPPPRPLIPGLYSPFHVLAAFGVDESDRPWIISLSRDPLEKDASGFVFDAWVTYYDEDHWTPPVLLARSGGHTSRKAAASLRGDDTFFVTLSADGRRERPPQWKFRPEGPVQALLTDNQDSDVYAFHLSIPRPDAAVVLSSASPPRADKTPSDETHQERQSIEAARNAHTVVDGEKLILARGDFHRHTEFSSDGGLDGTLEDLFRYAVDSAGLDFVMNSDHDNGNHREYTWWLTQKAVDAYTFSPGFTGLHGYERSVPWPEGHRNILFQNRGIRPLPRMPKVASDDPGSAPDTRMLYDFLEEFDALAFPHTTASQMGTDWRDHDGERERMVEIYQGSRFSYEREGAPRTETSSKTGSGNAYARGFINNALNKGYQFSFYASSDHFSTHRSYAMIWTPKRDRASIFESIRQRRTYGATDNIIAEFRATAGEVEGFMGASITVEEPPTYRVKLRGTAPFERVVFVHDDRIVHEASPDSAEVDISWTDNELTPGTTTWTYVRGEQVDGELVWVSPIWVTRSADAPGRDQL